MDTCGSRRKSAITRCLLYRVFFFSIYYLKLIYKSKLLNIIKSRLQKISDNFYGKCLSQILRVWDNIVKISSHENYYKTLNSKNRKTQFLWNIWNHWSVSNKSIWRSNNSLFLFSHKKIWCIRYEEVNLAWPFHVVPKNYVHYNNSPL